MDEKKLRKLLKKLNDGDELSSPVVEEIIVEFLRTLGAVLDDDPTRKLYKKFFNEVRLAESKYGAARDNLEKIEIAANIIREAMGDLDQQMS